MLTSCLDHTIRLYDLNNYKARMSYRAHLDSVNSINWVPMSNNFVSGSADKTCSLWDMRSNICVQTYYGHNSSILVSRGDKVFQGQHIAEAGNTGNSFGSHIHFGVKDNGSFQNPRNYLPEK